MKWTSTLFFVLASANTGCSATTSQRPPATASTAPSYSENSGGRSPGSASTEKKPGVEKPAAPEFASFRSTDFWSIYQNNKLAADERFKGRRFIIEGAITSIDQGPAGEVLLSMEAPNPLLPVLALMRDTERPKVAQMNVGRYTILVCVGGGRFRGSPLVGDCVFSKDVSFK
jgi:hypothetical protein